MFFGLAPIFAKLAFTSGISSSLLSALRFLIGAVILLVCMLVGGISLRVKPREIWKIAIVAAFYAAMIILLFSSYTYISSGLSTTLHFCYPVFVMVFSVVLMHRRAGLVEIVCVILAAAGIMLLNGAAEQTSTVGAAFAVLSGVSYAAAVILIELLKLDELPSVTLAFYISVFSSVYCSIFALISGNASGFGITVSSAVGILLLAVTTNVLAIVFFQKGLHLCGGVKASLLSTLEPLTSVVVGAAVYSEQVTFVNIIGMAMILLSAALLVIKPKDSGEPKKSA